MKEITKRSDCPISYTMDVFGDKWSLLILRDMIFKGKSTYGDFLQSDEKIATNILADRLKMLDEQGIIKKQAIAGKSKFSYSLTKKGIRTLPVIVESMIWGARYSPAGGNRKFLKQLKEDKKGVLKEMAKTLKKRMPA